MFLAGWLRRTHGLCLTDNDVLDVVGIVSFRIDLKEISRYIDEDKLFFQIMRNNLFFSVIDRGNFLRYGVEGNCHSVVCH